MDCPNPKKSTAAAAGLPDDPLVEILSRLPVKPLHRSKCVARSWRDLIDDPANQKKLAQTLEGFFLMDDGGDGGHFGFVNVLARSVPLDIDPSFSFLPSLPEIETLDFSDSCNGLLLFEHRRMSALGDQGSDLLGYIVCNPATKEWGAVPNCDCPSLGFVHWRYTYLVFDPAVTPHFHLVQFREESQPPAAPGEGFFDMATPHAYSSETGTWSHIQIDWNLQEEQGQLEVSSYHGLIPRMSSWHAIVNGMLHLKMLGADDVIVAVDVQGETRRIIPVPKVARWYPGYVAESQGCLHYLKESLQWDTLSIWILKDYGTQEWVLLDTLNFLELFGKKSYSDCRREFRVVTIHPDCNVIFLAQYSTGKLISYDMDRKEVSVIGTLGNLNRETHIVPYIPYFSESPVLKNMH
ncbi:hypothetical protein EJB05_14730, partial [Eragrostis curvula]